MYLFDQSTLTGHPYPYWFGETNLGCLLGKNGKRGKRTPTHRYTLSLSHRWIHYRGHYFEFIGPGSVVYSSISPFKAAECPPWQESRVAGYGVLSLDCIKRCTRNYEREFGAYNFVVNNCHVFANRISDMLCTASSCPSWCH